MCSCGVHARSTRLAASLPVKRLVSLCWLSTVWRSRLLISREMPLLLPLLSLLPLLDMLSLPAPSGPGWLGANTLPYEVASRSPSELTSDPTDMMVLADALRGLTSRARDLKVMGPWLFRTQEPLRSWYLRSFPRRFSFLARDAGIGPTRLTQDESAPEEPTDTRLSPA